MRRGVTLIELAVTLVVFGIVFGLVTRSALFHLRMQRRAQAADAAERATRQAVAIVARALDGAGAGDLLPNAGADSALDLMQRVGAGVGCVAGAELRTAAAGEAGARALAAFATAAKAGDRVDVLDDDAGPPRWLVRTVVATVPAVQPCAAAGVPPDPGVSLVLDSAVDAGPVVAFRVSRRTRYDLYRGGDGHWYLGMREWNAPSGGFNGVQPVAGPLHAYSVRAARTGLRFSYLDRNGRPVSAPAGTTAVAAVVVEARAPAPDSAVRATPRTVALHRAP